MMMVMMDDDVDDDDYAMLCAANDYDDDDDGNLAKTAADLQMPCSYHPPQKLPYIPYGTQ